MRKTVSTVVSAVPAAAAALRRHRRLRVAAVTAAAAAGLTVVPFAAAADGVPQRGAPSAAAVREAGRTAKDAVERREAAGEKTARDAAERWAARLISAGAAKGAKDAQAVRGAKEARKAKAAERARRAKAAREAKAAKERASRAARQRSALAVARSWTVPVSGYTLSAGFAQSGARWSSTHSGQDFAVSSGTPVRTVHTGTVVEAGWGGAYGNNIVVRHTDGHYSQYAHLSDIGVFVGQRVGTGQCIGLSGSTGNSTGPHLHFEIRTTPAYGSAVEPLSFLRGRGVGI